MNRSNDGLDPSSTTDAYGDGSRGGDGGNYRSNDGLDASGTSDALGGRGNQSGTYRTTDGLDPTGTSDAYGDSSNSRRFNNEDVRDSRPGGTSGGLGYDDTIGSGARTGGAERGGDQETSQHTSGGLGENDTYGDEADTGGADTGYDHNYGMGTGRTVSQEEGGPLPTEQGRDDVRREGDDFDERLADYKKGYDPETGRPYESQSGSGSGSSKKDSTTGKLMEKAGGLFKNENLREKGEEKRRQAGGDDY